MFRHSAFAKFLWLLAIAVLVVRVGDAHLHFCIDGQEQPLTLHVADAPGPHHADTADSGHNDRDLDLSGPTLVKKVVGIDDLTLAALLPFALVLLLPVVRRIAPVRDSEPFGPAHIFFLLPPLRGPPL